MGLVPGPWSITLGQPEELSEDGHGDGGTTSWGLTPPGRLCSGGDAPRKGAESSQVQWPSPQ